MRPSEKRELERERVEELQALEPLAPVPEEPRPPALQVRAPVVESVPEPEPSPEYLEDIADFQRFADKLERKKRTLSVSISLSIEEQQMLKDHVHKLKMPFATWARRTLFRAMGKKVPVRLKRGKK